ncbi:hypothetical protein NC651_032385 [Populus alba x Populus x berolinensis]|nr:hypothetical protein NC651_032385 [Populus alba x Populus x berolinensis]
METNRFVCEICNKGFQRDQNLKLHRRGHNPPWKLWQRTATEKHFSRKHGEKKWKCDKCSKKYAVQSDWKAHQKACGTREYKRDCGTIFSSSYGKDVNYGHFPDRKYGWNRRKIDKFCNIQPNVTPLLPIMQKRLLHHPQSFLRCISRRKQQSKPRSNGQHGFKLGKPNVRAHNSLKYLPQELVPIPLKSMNMAGGMFSSSSGTLFGSPRSISSTSSLQLSSKDSSGLHYLQDNKNGCQISASAHMSATAMLKKAAQMGATASNSINSPVMQKSFASSMAGPHDQLSSIKPPTYGRIQQHSTSYATSHHMRRVKLSWLESMALEDLVTSPCKEGHKKRHRYLTLVVQITQQ